MSQRGELEGLTTVLRSLASTGAWAVAGGVWALVPVGRARGVTRALLVAVPAAAAAAVAASGWRAKAGPEGETSLRAAVLVPVAAGGVMAFTHWASLVLDSGVEDFLARRGVRRPRLVMAGVAALATALWDRRAIALGDRREPLGDVRSPTSRAGSQPGAGHRRPSGRWRGRPLAGWPPATR